VRRGTEIKPVFFFPSTELEIRGERNHEVRRIIEKEKGKKRKRGLRVMWREGGKLHPAVGAQSGGKQRGEDKKGKSDEKEMYRPATIWSSPFQ